jgi:hypothetical protein
MSSTIITQIMAVVLSPDASADTPLGTVGALVRLPAVAQNALGRCHRN